MSARAQLALALALPPPVPRARRARPLEPAAPGAARLVRVQLALAFDAPLRARRALPVVAAAPAPGGPDPARPCDGCPARATCRAECPALAALLAPPEVRAWRERGSTALVTGARYGVDPRVAPDADDDPEKEEEAAPPPASWPALVAAHGPRLREVAAALGPTQRAAALGLLEGLRPVDVAQALRVTRQAVTRALRRAVRALRVALGLQPPPRCAPRGPATGERKLTPEAVVAMRALGPSVGATELARRFRVARGTARKVLAGRSYRWVGDPARSQVG